jgi:hypothetical protein
MERMFLLVWLRKRLRVMPNRYEDNIKIDFNEGGYTDVERTYQARVYLCNLFAVYLETFFSNRLYSVE